MADRWFQVEGDDTGHPHIVMETADRDLLNGGARYTLEDLEEDDDLRLLLSAWVDRDDTERMVHVLLIEADYALEGAAREQRA